MLPDALNFLVIYKFLNRIPHWRLLLVVSYRKEHKLGHLSSGLEKLRCNITWFSNTQKLSSSSAKLSSTKIRGKNYSVEQFMSTEHWITAPTHPPSPANHPCTRKERKHTSLPKRVQPLLSSWPQLRLLALHAWCQKISRYALSEPKWVSLKQKVRNYQNLETKDNFCCLASTPFPAC